MRLTIALALVVGLARRVDGQLLQLLLDGPSPECLLALLDPLEVGLPLTIGVAGGVRVGRRRRRGSRRHRSRHRWRPDRTGWRRRSLV